MRKNNSRIQGCRVDPTTQELVVCGMCRDTCSRVVEHCTPDNRKTLIELAVAELDGSIVDSKTKSFAHRPDQNIRGSTTMMPLLTCHNQKSLISREGAITQVITAKIYNSAYIKMIPL